MHARQLRVGDLVDDYCPRERRLSNHAIVALVGDDVRQVRCTTCDAEHEYRGGKVPASRRKKAVAGAPALAPSRAAESPAGRLPVEEEPSDAGQAAQDGSGAAPAAQAPEAAPRVAPEAEPEPEPAAAPTPHAEISLHRRLIRATLPRIEGDVPARPIPEFTMHRAAPAGHGQRHGKPFRHGPGGGPHRHGAKGGFGQGRHGQGEVNGNTFGSRGGQGQRGAPGGHGGAHGPRGTHRGPAGPGGQGNPGGQRHVRHGFGGRPPRGPKKP
jgi:hypothetical protein